MAARFPQQHPMPRYCFARRTVLAIEPHLVQQAVGLIEQGEPFQAMVNGRHGSTPYETRLG